MTSQKTFALNDIAAQLACGNVISDIQITGIAPLASATAEQLSFLHNPRYKKFLADTKAAAVIIPASVFAELQQEHTKLANTILLPVADAQQALLQMVHLFDDTPVAQPGIHPSAVIGADCDIADDVSIAANCVLGAGVKLAKGVVIEANCSIGEGSRLGENSKLFAGVKVYHKVVIGERVLVHSGAVLGSDGFGNAQTEQGWQKIPQIGGLQIGDDVEIGANTTIDRGALDDTIIGRGVKLDNLIQIAHNVVIGEHTAVAAGVGIAGSTQIGKQCMIGGQAGIAGHIKITDGVILSGQAMVTRSIDKPGMYSSGTGLQPNKTWRRNAVRFKHLDELIKKITTALGEKVNE